MTDPAEQPEKEAPTFETVIAGRPHGGVCHIARRQGLLAHQESWFVPVLPVVRLFCVKCDGEMNFDGWWAGWIDVSDLGKQNTLGAQRAIVVFNASSRVAHYRCRHCQNYIVRIAMRIDFSDEGFSIRKIGQDPPFAPRIPTRVQRFLNGGDDWKLYLKGWAAENAGQGIGAYAYYRRVVEDVWDRVLDRLIDAATRLGDSQSADELNRAKGQRQFSQSVDDVKVAVPSPLMIDTQNPIALLHRAFSAGVHELDDEECLQLAADGRRVLERLLATLHEALKDDQELKQSVARLAAIRKPKSTT